ncbi:MAG: DEAD/DEAH box helicase family protein [Turicibacter sp.]|nr:DEAD/DEAH box helicase family protein [Turicibacter sp.]
MLDISGREWHEDEYLRIFKKGLVYEADIVKVIGIQNETCERCLNQSKEWFGTFSYKGKSISYCRQCLDFKMVDSQHYLYRSLKPPTITKNAHVLNLDFKLSSLQQRASDFAKKMFKQQDRGLVWAVCGAGKTEMMFETISLALEEGKRVCWAIPRADVVIELVPRLKQAFPYAKVIGLHGHSKEKVDYADIVISTTHQLIRFYQAFDLLIIDEVDAFPYTFDEMLPRLAKKACKPTCATIYLSATPSKEDQLAIKKKKLACCIIPARYHLYSLDVPIFRWSGNVEKALKRQRLPKVVLSWLKKKILIQRRALLFVPTIEAGFKLQKTLNHLLNLEVPFVYSSDEERLAKVKSFKEGEGQFLITTMILERGVTIVDIDVAVFCAEHEVYEESALVQISGRVGRSPKYPHGEIIFFHYGVTQAMYAAREQIKQMNQRAQKQHLLKEEFKHEVFSLPSINCH